MKLRRAALVALWLATAGSASALDVLTPLEERGRQIFRTGQSAGAPIIARLGLTGVSLPATSLVCADCHGRGGRGSLEGGVVTPDIRWNVLTQPAERVGPSGRHRPAYDLLTLRRAIAGGRDAAGNPLHVAMPNYQLEDDDFDALVAYLRSLTRTTDAGVSDESVTLLLALPSRGSAQPIAEVLQRTLENELAGPDAPKVNGRAIKLRVIDSAPAGGMQALMAATEEASPLAVVAPLFESPRDAEDAERLWAELGALVIGPVRADNASPRANEAVFELVPSRAEQLRAVQRIAREQRGAVTVLAQRGSWLESWRHLLTSEATEPKADWALTEVEPEGLDAARLIAGLQAGSPSLVVLLADPAVASQILRELRRVAFSGQTITLSASLDARTLADKTMRPDLLVVSAGSQRTPDLARRTSALSACRAQGFWPLQAPTCLFAMDTAAVALEALRRAGRELTADRLGAALMTLQHFAVPSGQNITFSANRHDGAREVHVARLASGSVAQTRVAKARPGR